MVDFDMEKQVSCLNKVLFIKIILIICMKYLVSIQKANLKLHKVYLILEQVKYIVLFYLLHKKLPCFNKLYLLFYKVKKKVIPSNIGDYLTPLSLAYWICDEG